MIQAKVITIGAQAVGDDKMLILFNETATDALKQYSIIQEVEGEPEFGLAEKGQISFDDRSLR